MRRRLFGKESDTSAAVAPLVGLSLFVMVGAGALAFDYARLATLDTELQNAADQAALAAATQLDQKSGAIARATAAAQGLIRNGTVMASHSGGTTDEVTISEILFYETKPNAEGVNGQSCPTANTVTANATAHFVCVRTLTRTARFALTPILRASLRSGAAQAMAVAGLGSAICKTPPVMICNPNEGADSSFTVANYVGKGLRLVSVGGGNGSWAAGNFGYLDTYGGANGVPGLQEALGWVTPPGECLKFDGVDTKPGANTPATDAFNTRFDVYDNGSCQTGGLCPTSINTVKDLVRAGDASGNNACRLHNDGWREVTGDANRYMPNSSNALTPLPDTVTPLGMGHPRDMCHAAAATATNYCTGPIGTGEWDRDAYFRSNYGWTSAAWKTNTGLTATATRYQVYTWEIANRGTIVGGVTVLAPQVAQGSGASARRRENSPICSSLQTPSYGTGVIPGGSNPDRRRISVAVVNCSNGDGGTAVNGASDGVTVQKWIEVFLVEPSLSRGSGNFTPSGSTSSYARSGTGAGDAYVEVIGETTASGAGATAGQVVRRDVPYLVK